MPDTCLKILLFFLAYSYSNSAFPGGIPEKELTILETTFTEVGLRRSDSDFVASKGVISANAIRCNMAKGRSVYHCQSVDLDYEFFCQVASEHEIKDGKMSNLSTEGHYIQCESDAWFCEKSLNKARACLSRIDFEKTKLKKAPVTTGGKPIEQMAEKCIFTSKEFRTILERFLSKKAPIERIKYINTYRDKSSLGAFLLDLCEHEDGPAEKY